MWAVRLLIAALAVVPVLSTAVLVSVDPLLVRLGAVWLMPLVSISAPLAGVAMLLLALAEPDRTARLPLTLLQTMSSLLVVLSVGLLAPPLVVALLVATLLMVALHAGSEVFHRVHDAAVTALVTLLTVSSAALVVALVLLVLLVLLALVARLLAVLVLLIVLLSLLASMLLALLVVLTLLMALLSLLVPVLLALLITLAPLMLVAPHAGNDVFDRVGDAPPIIVLSTTSLLTACLVMLSPVCPLAASIDALRVVVPVVSCLLPFVSVLTEVMWEVCHGSWSRTAVVDAIVQRVGDRTRTTATPTERL
ncbi:hypothetical protein BRD06_02190 [Halobacteriales archaeon QS_9_67_15]|nr:MAG: hypothetical protein BRD06_02190 [Halobacteriales archaeon QS_9_67_15]